MKIKVNTIAKGKAEGEAVVSSMNFSFLGDFNVGNGEGSKVHSLSGANISGKILVIPTGRGSTAGALIGYYAKLLGTLPKGIICLRAEPVIAINGIMNGIPIVDRPDQDIFQLVNTGDVIRIDTDKGIIEIVS